uniref:Bifunctional lysine-specific demethylase and histidyl-hydroxylase n=1 Tax=Pseudictyota dubia TaxID=2749911 RepID=A0A7R9VM90_9STRA
MSSLGVSVSDGKGEVSEEDKEGETPRDSGRYDKSEGSGCDAGRDACLVPIHPLSRLEPNKSFLRAPATPSTLPLPASSTDRQRRRNASAFRCDPDDSRFRERRSSAVGFHSVFWALVFFLSLCVGESSALPPESPPASCSSPYDSPKHRRTESLPLLDNLFPNHSLDGAWESHPLLSTVFPSLLLGSANRDSDVVPVVGLGDDTNDAARSRRISAFQSIFSLFDAHKVLSQPDLVHTEDFQLVKKIVRDGQEWNGMPPERSITSDHAAQLFDLGGFSLVVNAMQRRWGNIGAISRVMQEEVGCNYVSCNLYATPSVVEKRPPRPGEEPRPKMVAQRSGFESHWDWMDVIVVQISGSKLWSVATEPLVYLSTQDLKRKPTIEEMKEYIGDKGRYREFLLRPGDAMYIPRGFLHNASTVGPDAGLVNALFNGSEADNDGDDNDSTLWQEPSLHLTFGIEHTCMTTYEALLQHAMHLFGNTEAGKQVAVSSKKCGTEQDILWHHMLTLAISDVARRGCGGRREGFEDIPPYLSESWSATNGTASDSVGDMNDKIHGRDDWERDSCLLRKSVPRSNPWREVMAFRQKQNEENEFESSMCDSNMGHDSIDPVRTNYNSSLAALRNLASPRALSSFLRRLRNMADEGTLASYCLPLLRDWVILSCPQDELDSVTADDMLAAMQKFVQFAEEKYDVVLQQFEGHLQEYRDQEWRKDDYDLRAIGQLHKNEQSVSLQSLLG